MHTNVLPGGQLESTLLHSFHRGAAIRRWLLRADCPPLLKYCFRIIDKAYNYRKKGQATDEDKELSDDLPWEDIAHGTYDDPPQFEALKWVQSAPPPPELVSACGNSKIRCFSRVRAVRGYYTIPTATAIGNSYVCFKDGDTWATGQIQHIFDFKDGDMHYAINRSKSLQLSQSRDPFAAFWFHGFQAKMVSSSFSKKLEIVSQKELLGHVARWELIKGRTVVLSLARVRDFHKNSVFSTEQPLGLNIQKGFHQVLIV